MVYLVEKDKKADAKLKQRSHQSMPRNPEGANKRGRKTNRDYTLGDRRCFRDEEVERDTGN